MKDDLVVGFDRALRMLAGRAVSVARDAGREPRGRRR